MTLKYCLLTAVMSAGGFIAVSSAFPQSWTLAGTTNRNWTSVASSSIDLVLQENSDLSTINWTDVTIPPTLNVTNLQNQVTVPPPAGNRFYRLNH